MIQPKKIFNFNKVQMNVIHQVKKAVDLSKLTLNKAISNKLKNNNRVLNNNPLVINKIKEIKMMSLAAVVMNISTVMKSLVMINPLESESIC